MAVAVPGDVYRLGRHRLMCGDATDPAAVAALMAGESAGMLLTDPPYGIDYSRKDKWLTKYRVNGRLQGRTGACIANDRMDEEALAGFLEAAFRASDAVLEPGAVCCVWYSDLKAWSFLSALREVGWKHHETLIWAKNRMVLGRYDYQWKHEPCWYGWKPGAAHVWNNDRKQTTLIEAHSPLRNKLHPTMKPVGLFDYLIRNGTNDGATVLDPFAGSGTTLIACEYNGRAARCMEIQPEYCDIIIDRYAKAAFGYDSIQVERGGELLPYSEICK